MKIYKAFFRIFTFVSLLLIMACSSSKLQPTQYITTLTASTLATSASANPPIDLRWTQYPPVPTITFELQDKMYELLKNNGGCELPCFLGVTPGHTLWTDAKPFLELFSITKIIKPDQVASTEMYTVYNVQVQTSKDISLLMNIRLDVDSNNLVQYIIFDADIRRGKSVEYRDTHLSRYSLHEILQRHGVPDAIYMTPIRQNIYSMHIVYENIKITISFTGRATQNLDGGYTVCPNLGDGGIGSIKLAISNPSNPIDVRSLVGYPFWNETPLLEKVSGVSKKYFYQLLIGDQQSACFETK